MSKCLVQRQAFLSTSRVCDHGGRSRRANSSDQNACPFLEAWGLRLITVTYCLFPLRNSFVFQWVGALKANLYLERLSVRKGDTWSRRNVRLSRREERRKSCRLREPVLALLDLGCLLLSPSPHPHLSHTSLSFPTKVKKVPKLLASRVGTPSNGLRLILCLNLLEKIHVIQVLLSQPPSTLGNSAT